MNSPERRIKSGENLLKTLSIMILTYYEAVLRLEYENPVFFISNTLFSSSK
jgi:hypothetical protein